MAQTKTFNAEAESAFGNQLPEKVNYSYSANLLEASSEIPADEVPSPSDILTLVNNKRKATARQKAMLKKFAELALTVPEGEFNPYKAPVVDASAQGILVAAKDTVKTLIKTGKSEADAKQQAAALFGVSIELL